ncbi:hypothetical protein EV356DRAFT_356546 [Viridothelium virens]|uniref:Tetratricopeptide repeat protein n=1 Tax=Viridothelium virens TaxID=1048519 RepID=A0A6A6HI04_VIRVR|nr:hypothetical protein EV356DRAFT_356546 [Viridothelium virens]
MAETIYQRALQGFEKALGREAVKSYLPALFAEKNLARLLEGTGRIKEAEEMYSRALAGAETVFGHGSERCQHIYERFNVLRRSSL